MELGANGLLFGGEATVGSPVAGALRIAPALDFPTSGASTPPANFWRQYGDANGVYFRNSAGVIFPVPFYEETSWIPTVEFATPGTPTFTYTLQVGRAIRVGKLVTAWFHVAVNPFSYTGSSGLFRVRSVPYAPASQTVRYVGPCQMRGYTKAGYDHIQTLISPADGSVYLLAGGSALTPALLTTTEVPSGSVIDIEGSITYQMA